MRRLEGAEQEQRNVIARIADRGVALPSEGSGSGDPSAALREQERRAARRAHPKAALLLNRFLLGDYHSAKALLNEYSQRVAGSIAHSCEHVCGEGVLTVWRGTLLFSTPGEATCLLYTSPSPRD